MLLEQNQIHLLSSLELLQRLPDQSIDLVYTDPPFGTNQTQRMNRKKAGKTVSSMQYSDRHVDYLDFIRPNVVELRRVLKQSGTMYLHLDTRWVHYVKVMCDEIFGYDNFLNELIWGYNFGGRGKKCWPKKHDSVLVYVKEKGKHVFNYEDIDRVPYLAPELQKDPERVKRGQVPTDVWPLGIIGTASKERVGWPNQKPIKLMRRAIVASSPAGGTVLDPFAGSGSTGAAALACDRTFIMCDQNQDAFDVMKARFGDRSDVVFFFSVTEQ